MLSLFMREREREVTIFRVIILENEKEAGIKEFERGNPTLGGGGGGGVVQQESFLLCLIESKTLDTRGQ